MRNLCALINREERQNMQNIKHHVLNTITMVMFSIIMSATITQFIRFGLTEPAVSQMRRKSSGVMGTRPANYDDYKIILDSGFFKASSPLSSDGGSAVSTEASSLILLGTITGPASIARALIKKSNENEPRIYRLWSSLDGWKVVRIDNSKVYLKGTGGSIVLDMFAGRDQSSGETKAPAGDSTSKNVLQTISKAELQQKVLNNMDNALRGLRAGPYRVDGKIEGYKLFRVHPSSVLYKFGARSGDVVKRVNGHPVDSTDKLYKMWENMKNDTKISVDLQRGDQLFHYDFTIKE